MIPTEQQILQTLLALEKAAADPKPDLLPILSRLDELSGQLPSGTHPDLLHYLRRKSYQKAAAFLQHRQTRPN